MVNSPADLARLVVTICVAVAMALGFVAAPAGAAPVTFDFQGTVTLVGPSSPAEFAALLPVGSVLTGSYTFDSTSPDLALPGFGTYAGSSLSLNVGTLSAVSDGSSLRIHADPGFFGQTFDVYTVETSLVPQAFGGLTLSFFTFILQLPNGTLPNELLPLLPPPLPQPASTLFAVLDTGGPGRGIFGAITSLTLHETTAVPEPAPLLLLLAALPAIAVVKAARRNWRKPAS